MERHKRVISFASPRMASIDDSKIKAWYSIKAKKKVTKIKHRILKTVVEISGHSLRNSGRAWGELAPNPHPQALLCQSGLQTHVTTLACLTSFLPVPRGQAVLIVSRPPLGNHLRNSLFLGDCACLCGRAQMCLKRTTEDSSFLDGPALGTFLSLSDPWGPPVRWSFWSLSESWDLQMLQNFKNFYSLEKVAPGPTPCSLDSPCVHQESGGKDAHLWNCCEDWIEIRDRRGRKWQVRVGMRHQAAGFKRPLPTCQLCDLG